MVPSSIAITSRQAMMIEGLFGRSTFIQAEQVESTLEDELKLFDKI
jgi:hypothetical protein